MADLISQDGSNETAGPLTPLQSTAKVEVLSEDECAWKVLPFAIRLPESVLQLRTKLSDAPSAAEAATQLPHSLLETQHGIVGTITLLNKSVLIWFGWGKLRNNDENSSSNEKNSSGSHGSCSSLSMGPLLISVPFKTYQGAFGENNHAGGSCSKLVGSDREDDQEIGQGMASRLCQKLGQASVLVSCHLQGQTPAELAVGMDTALLHHQVAAHAEREMYRLLALHFAANK